MKNVYMNSNIVSGCPCILWELIALNHLILFDGSSGATSSYELNIYHAPGGYRAVIGAITL